MPSANATPERDDTVVATTGLGKRYAVADGGSPRLRDHLLGKLYRQRRQRDHWALRNIDLSVSRGTLLGVVGPNGSGKSTLLKLLAGIATPTEGSTRVVGRVAALMEVGVGFHPDLTGWENVFLNGSLLGMPRSEIRSRLGDIVAFADIDGRFLDLPVKYYSSGMHARLGFAIAVHSNPDLLLVDELLAVGDSQFQAKSFDRLMEMRRDGRTIILVTHNVRAAGEICDEVARLDSGRLVGRGDPAEMVAAYQRDIMERTIDTTLGQCGDPDTMIEVVSANVADDDGESLLKTVAPATLEVEIQISAAPVDASATVLLTRSDGWIVAEIDSRQAGVSFAIEDDVARLRLRFDPLLLMGGAYSMDVILFGPNDKRLIGIARRALEFSVAETKHEGLGYLADIPCEWTTGRNEA